MLLTYLRTSEIFNSQVINTSSTKQLAMMPTLFAKWSTKSSSSKPPLVAKAMETKKPIPITMFAAFLRLQPSLSISAEVTASMMEMCELKPATTKAKKNKGPKMYGIGNKLIAAGKVTKARPTPAETTSVNGFPCS
ncbi:Uncharacterised protein [Vibrio cholerae]|nr:Uncharacterised protein [Vibrio cholerae]CSI73382.1 Uncharacterised protein [Vibrio cholerae]